MIKYARRDIAWREFHISRKARDRYEFDQTLFATNGNIIFANFRGVLVFAQKMNEKRDLVRFPEKTVKAGQINAMGLIDEILHYVVAQYRDQKNPEVMAEALEWLDAKVGKEEVNKVLSIFTDVFPPVAVYRREISAGDYLAGETTEISNRQIAMEELLMLWFSNIYQII